MVTLYIAYIFCIIAKTMPFLQVNVVIHVVEFSVSGTSDIMTNLLMLITEAICHCVVPP